MARLYSWFVIVFWAASMSWLVASKVLPPLLGGHPPDFKSALRPDELQSPPVSWRIAWNERRIGTAASQLIRRPSGGTAQRYVVHFERLPLQAMLSESFGMFGSALKSMFGMENNVEMDLLLATELRFNERHEFSDFRSVADIGGLHDILRVRGVVDEHQKLKLTTHVGSPAPGQARQVLRHEINLPRESLISDAFAPRAELRNLRVGQRWSIPIYRPLPGNNAVQIVEAVAERLDVIVWDAKDVETVLVVYREEAGSGLHASREPIAQEWVRADGMVLQRVVRLSGLKITFERLPATAMDPEIEMLDDEKFPRLWSS